MQPIRKPPFLKLLRTLQPAPRQPHLLIPLALPNSLYLPLSSLLR